jgi:protein phosphatase
MTLSIPKLSLVVLIGPSGAGKSTFARKHFLPTEIVSSDACRAMLSDDENNLNVTAEAFDLVHTIAAKRLALGKLTVIDATSVQQEARAPLVALARKFHCLPVAIVLNLPEEVCLERNRHRPDRSFGPHVVRNQRMQLRRSLKGLKREGFRNITILDTLAEVDSVVVERVPLWNDKSHEHGPFDIIGDVHGCADELEQLLEKLGYANEPYRHPAGRRAVFVGDLVDRGPRVLDSLRIVRNMVLAGSAFCVPGNHDMKLLKKLRGKDVQITHGLAQTLAEIDALPAEVRDVFVPELAGFLEAMVSHYVFDGGKLVVAHAGLKQEMQGRGSAKVRDFCLYGETTGETDEFGLPIRLNWAAEYRGHATVVYGHTPVPEAEWLNNTVDVDTGCVFGGKLTALRWPEREFVAVPALRTYCEPARPFLKTNTLNAQQELDTLLDAEDVLGKRIISTGLRGNIIIREANATAALEVMSRFAADPRWLIYLPPTMSPSETSSEPGLLEHPAEAFAYYRNQGVIRVVCEEKHMGSRAVAVLCKDESAARERFGIDTGEVGIITTRTGRRFFNDAALERQLLDRLRAAITTAELWNQLNTTWLCLDCELMPWSAKAQALLQSQYAAVGSAGRASTPVVVQSLATSGARLNGEEKAKLDAVVSRMTAQASAINKFVTAYRQYCWPVNSIEDYKLAPFHIMASEGKVHTDRPHTWHMDTLATVCQADPAILLATRYKVVELADPASEAEGIAWWTEMAANGGEGMVVKPLDFLHRGVKGLAQPAIKCRGPEYLRIIYGPDYDTEANLVRLRKRGLGHKRKLALSEFSLGVEALQRFVRREPLRRVHECVFGVLALESEPVDPRL